ncbi:DUF2157 domain-containing protein [Thermogutta sp.]|uniref:DUF2157 domain-containing protein n=1 Tax=Thermogutta sp. TaxID=1962930 RepID=UPI003C7DC4CE
MAPRQIPGRFYRWLVQEIKFWQENQLVSEEQGARILAYYEVRRPGTAFGLPITSVFCGIGGVLIALASLLVIHALRNVVSEDVRLALVWVVFFAWHGVALLPRGADFLQQALREGLLLGTSVYFGGAVFFIPDILGVPVETVWSACGWAVGIWGIAFLLRDTLLLQALLLVGVLLTALIESNSLVSWLPDGASWRLATHGFVAILSLAIFTSLAWLAERRKNQLALLCCIGAFTLWFLLAIPYELTDGREIHTFAVSAAVGAVLWLCGEVFPAPAVVTGGCMVGGGLFSLIGWGFLNSPGMYPNTFDSPTAPFGFFFVYLRVLMLVVVTLAVIAAAWKQIKRRQDTVTIPREFLQRAVPPVVCLILSLLIYLCLYLCTPTEESLSKWKSGYLLLAVIGISVLAITNVIRGVNRGRVFQIGVGLSAFLVGISVWWSNFFGYSELAGAALFAVAGLGLVAGGLYWIRRRPRERLQEEQATESASSEGESASGERVVPLANIGKMRLAHLVVLLLQTVILYSFMWAAAWNWLSWRVMAGLPRM